MEDVIRRKIQAAYTGLRPSERKVADYFLHVCTETKSLRIEEVARLTGVSKPTILRFLKALGYQGFKEFKYALIQEEVHKKQEENYRYIHSDAGRNIKECTSKRI